MYYIRVPSILMMEQCQCFVLGDDDVEDEGEDYMREAFAIDGQLHERADRSGCRASKTMIQISHPRRHSHRVGCLAFHLGNVGLNSN